MLKMFLTGNTQMLDLKTQLGKKDYCSKRENQSIYLPFHHVSMQQEKTVCVPETRNEVIFSSDTAHAKA